MEIVEDSSEISVERKDEIASVSSLETSESPPPSIHSIPTASTDPILNDSEGGEMSTDDKENDRDTPSSNPSLETSGSRPSVPADANTPATDFERLTHEAIPPILTVFLAVHPLLRHAIQETPFTIPLPLNLLQSLKTLTAKLLLARQKGRLIQYHTLWTVTEISDGVLPPDATASYTVSFADEMSPGIRMCQLANEDRSEKLCSFGCTRHGRHQFLSNSGYLLFCMLLRC